MALCRSSRRTRSRQVDSARPLCRARSLLDIRALFRSTVRMARSASSNSIFIGFSESSAANAEHIERLCSIGRATPNQKQQRKTAQRFRDLAMKTETLAVHAGRADLKTLGVHALPIDLSSTYPVYDLAEGTASLDALVAGDATAANPIYSRLYNPTVHRFEQALAALEQAKHG